MNSLSGIQKPIGPCVTTTTGVGLGAVNAAMDLNQARLEFTALVKDHAPWDFKHKIRDQLGRGVTYCSSAGCHNDIEFSVAGNIHFGFVAREALYPELAIALGAAWAEKDDPAHDPERAKAAGVPYVGPYKESV